MNFIFSRSVSYSNDRTSGCIQNTQKYTLHVNHWNEYTTTLLEQKTLRQLILPSFVKLI